MPLPMVLEDVLTRWKVKIDDARRDGLTWSEAVSLIYDGLGEAFQVMAAITALSGPEKKQLVMQFADQLFEFAIDAIPPTGAYGWIVWFLRSQIKSILLDAFGAFIEKLYRDKVRGDA